MGAAEGPFAWPVPAELAAFADEPAQMASGAVGKAGALHLGFARRGERTILADLSSRAPYLAQRALHCDEALPDMAWVYVVATSGCVLQGDRMALAVTVGEGARAHVTTQSATKIHAMDANFALASQTITLAPHAYLEYLPDPLLPHRQARFASDTRIVVDPTATLLASEIVQSGRRHHRADEAFGATLLVLATQATRPDGTPLFAEKLVIEPARHDVRQTGVMGDFEVFANVILCAPPAVAAAVEACTRADVDADAGLAYGACRLPNDAGLVFKVVGRETEPVRARVREFWAAARAAATGAAVPAPPLWR